MKDDRDLPVVVETPAATDLSRREFLALGSGLFVFCMVDPLGALQEGQRARQGYPTDLNAYLRIAPDGRVTCMVGKIEMGQGVMTSLAQLLANELDVPLDAVDMIMGDTDRCPWDMGTFGSLSIRQFGPVLRAAAAEARAVLLQMAGERLHAPAERLQVKDGVVTDAQQGTHVSYGELVKGQRIERHIEKVPIKLPAMATAIGQSPARKDALEKVTGKARYAGDITLPGMLHARVLRPPAHGSSLKEVDSTAAEKVPGVRVIHDKELLAVLHERRDVADQALALVRASFNPPPPGPDDQTIFEHLLRHAPQARVVHEAGRLADGEKAASTVVEQTYLNSYVSHAPIETHCATAQIENGKVTVWASTQTPFPVKQQVAQALGVPPENVRIITPYVGGGFGGKSASRQATEAARLARLTGKPVQVVWDRAEEFFYDTFRPAAVVKARAGADGAGKLVLWQFDICAAGDRGAQHFYDIPHERTTSAGGWQGGNPPEMHPFAVGPWRAPSNNTNTFARESQIDVLAAKLRLDPVEFRRRNLSDQRMLRVLDAASRQFDWKPAPTPSGRGAGVACGVDAGSYVATMVQVAVDKRSGSVRVERVVCAQDQGVIVNPDGSRQQMEGCITMGLGYALAEEVRFRDGQVLDRNFDAYEIPRFTWLPSIETVLVKNDDVPPQGGGEPAIITMGAVIANAIFDAVGARLLQLPMTPARVLAAMKRA